MKNYCTKYFRQEIFVIYGITSLHIEFSFIYWKIKFTNVHDYTLAIGVIKVLGIVVTAHRVQ